MSFVACETCYGTGRIGMSCWCSSCNGDGYFPLPEKKEVNEFYVAILTFEDETVHLVGKDAEELLQKIEDYDCDDIMMVAKNILPTLPKNRFLKLCKGDKIEIKLEGQTLGYQEIQDVVSVTFVALVLGQNYLLQNLRSTK